MEPQMEHAHIKHVLFYYLDYVFRQFVFQLTTYTLMK